jgi:hypothetical protein
MASTGNIIRRLEALEQAIAPPAQRPVLVNVWTKSLAERIEKALPKDRDIRLVYLSFPDEKAELRWEASLRKSNPAEAKRLDELLAGALNQVW